jgi:hypothetical protein
MLAQDSKGLILQSPIIGGTLGSARNFPNRLSFAGP